MTLRRRNGLLLAALLLMLALPLSTAIWGHAWPSWCLFERATGMPCPFCGLTRSVACALEGDFLLSLRFHPLGIASLLLAFAAAILLAVEWVADRPGLSDRLLANHRLWIAVAVVWGIYYASVVVRYFFFPAALRLL